MRAAPATAAQAIAWDVQRLYETYPYPQYPLLAKPRWVDGYLASSYLAAQLAAPRGADVSPRPASPRRAGAAASAAAGAPRILIGGAGEILPYVMQAWEPRAHAVLAVDLSRRSLRRARWRLMLGLRRPCATLCSDLDHYLATAVASFAHIDLFGVLHHLPSPSATLAATGDALVPGGTLRLMVYNSSVRGWIRAAQRLFALLRLDGRQRADVAAAREILTALAAGSPALAARLRQMGQGSLGHDGRFADTFMHPREARLSPAQWLAALAAAGLAVAGQLDRYGELDDLANPLWQPPSAAALMERCADRRFEGNLELWAVRPLAPGESGLTAPQLADRGPRASLRQPPRLWFSFPETAHLPWRVRQRLWQAFLAPRQRAADLTALLRDLPLASAQRLARLGAILPGAVRGTSWEERLSAPMASDMEAPQRLPAGEIPAAVLATISARLGSVRPGKGGALAVARARLAQIMSG